MSVFDLFSKRMKAERGELPDVYKYDEIPQSLKVQVVHIIQDAFGTDSYFHSAEEAFAMIKNGLCREYGVFELFEGARYQSAREEVLGFFLNSADLERAIDVIELTFRVIDRVIRDNYAYKEHTKPKCTAEEAITELNERFQYAAFGYRYEAGTVVRISTEFTHSEVVRPALRFLSDRRFSGANEEFLLAHQFFRSGENKDCINNCLKAFESTMKTICMLRKIEVDKEATAKALISALFKNEFIPTYLQSQFSSLQNLFESGIPTIRNKSSGHGQGAVVLRLEDSFTAFVLHLTASNIVFLGSLLET